MSKRPFDHYGDGSCVCGHDRATHYKEMMVIETDEGVRSVLQYRTCVGMFCDCKGYLKKKELK